MIKFIDYSRLDRDILTSGDYNDCVVLSFMVALNITYKQSHYLAKEVFNRKPKEGVSLLEYVDLIDGKYIYGKKVELLGFSPYYLKSRNCLIETKRKFINPKYKNETGYTIESFIKEHNKGNYVLALHKHSVAIKNGILYGAKDELQRGLKRRVNYALKITNN
jgi:hypothetical protein